MKAAAVLVAWAAATCLARGGPVPHFDASLAAVDPVSARVTPYEDAVESYRKQMDLWKAKAEHPARAAPPAAEAAPLAVKPPPLHDKDTQQPIAAPATVAAPPMTLAVTTASLEPEANSVRAPAPSFAFSDHLATVSPDRVSVTDIPAASAPSSDTAAEAAGLASAADGGSEASASADGSRTAAAAQQPGAEQARSVGRSPPVGVATTAATAPLQPVTPPSTPTPVAAVVVAPESSASTAALPPETALAAASEPPPSAPQTGEAPPTAVPSEATGATEVAATEPPPPMPQTAAAATAAAAAAPAGADDALPTAGTPTLATPPAALGTPPTLATPPAADLPTPVRTERAADPPTVVSTAPAGAERPADLLTVVSTASSATAERSGTPATLAAAADHAVPAAPAADLEMPADLPTRTMTSSAAAAVATAAEPVTTAPASVGGAETGPDEKAAAGGAPVAQAAPAAPAAPAGRDGFGKLNGYVINMDTDVERYHDFSVRWQQAWPDLHITRVPAVVRSERGLGLTLSYVDGLQRALDDGTDVAFFFEDDAAPFAEARFPGDMTEMLRSWPADSSILLLGGHHVYTTHPPDLASHLTQIDRAYGTYAWAVRRTHMRLLLAVWKEHAVDSTLKARSVDLAWADLWKRFPAYIATPLVCDHTETGVSHTWRAEGKEEGNVERYRKWEGKREWWLRCVHDSCDHLSDYFSVDTAEALTRFFGLGLKERPVKGGNHRLDHAGEGKARVLSH